MHGTSLAKVSLLKPYLIAAASGGANLITVLVVGKGFRISSNIDHRAVKTLISVQPSSDMGNSSLVDTYPFYTWIDRCEKAVDVSLTWYQSITST